MSLQAAVLLGVEQAINQALDLDPYTAERLAAFHGKVIGFEFLGLGQCFYLVPGARGRIQLFSRIEGEPDCLTRGAPLDLLRAAFMPNKEAALFSGRVKIQGDTRLAQGFSELLAGLDLDWEEALSRLVGDALAHETGQGIAAARRWMGRSLDIARQDLGEYLQEEARLLPTRFELEEWQDHVDRLRDDLERLKARIARLERRSRDSGGAS